MTNGNDFGTGLRIELFGFGDFDCRPCPSTHIFMKYVNRLGMLMSPDIGRNAIKISFLDRHVKTTLKR